MPYQLPPDIAQRVRAQIERGQFETEADVLRAAIDMLERRQRGLETIRNMVREVEEDIAASRVGPFDGGETKRAVEERVETHGTGD